jgi:hypothetical protein
LSVFIPTTNLTYRRVTPTCGFRLGGLL